MFGCEAGILAATILRCWARTCASCWMSPALTQQLMLLASPRTCPTAAKPWPLVDGAQPVHKPVVAIVQPPSLLRPAARRFLPQECRPCPLAHGALLEPMEPLAAPNIVRTVVLVTLLPQMELSAASMTSRRARNALAPAPRVAKTQICLRCVSCVMHTGIETKYKEKRYKEDWMTLNSASDWLRK